MLQIQSLVIRFTTSLQSQLAAVEARDAKFADQLRRSLLSVGLSRSGRSPASWTESTEDHGPSGARERPTGAVNLGEGYGASERRVAVKLSNPTEADSAEARARFIREARAQAQLPLDHIVQVLDVDRLPAPTAATLRPPAMPRTTPRGAEPAAPRAAPRSSTTGAPPPPEAVPGDAVPLHL